MNPILLLLLSNCGAGLGEDALLLWALASQQAPNPTGTTTTTTTAPAAPASTAAIDPFLLLLLMGGIGKGGGSGLFRGDKRIENEAEKKTAVLGCAPGIDRTLLLTLLLTSQSGQGLGSIGAGMTAPAAGTTTAIDPTTLLLLTMVGGGGDGFSGREALRKHFIRERIGVDPDADSTDAG